VVMETCFSSSSPFNVFGPLSEAILNAIHYIFGIVSPYMGRHYLRMMGHLKHVVIKCYRLFSVIFGNKRQVVRSSGGLEKSLWHYDSSYNTSFTNGESIIYKVWN